MKLTDQIRENMEQVLQFTEDHARDIAGSPAGQRLTDAFNDDETAWAEALAENGIPNDEMTNAIAAIVLDHLAVQSQRVAIEKGVILPLATIGEIGGLMRVFATAFRAANQATTEVSNIDWDGFAASLVEEAEPEAETKEQPPRRFEAGPDGIAEA